ncbi:hypothetical protein N7523_004771 [Penicillium sp. IBT 18751x]|nr:hypothetical protein N7523_004771 [Penicillium sp. IBT 18751x]
MNPSIVAFRRSLQSNLRVLQARIQVQSPPVHTVVLRNPQSRTPSYALMFSTKSMSLHKMLTERKPVSKEFDSDLLQTPSVSLESLGIGKKMKVFLIFTLCVLGTIETWFWCKAIWIWWKGRQEDSEMAR